MKKIYLLLAALPILASCAAPKPVPVVATDRKIEQRIFQQINLQRHKKQQPKLSYHNGLAAIARQHSYELTADHKPLKLSISHSGFPKRVMEARALGMTKVSENVGASQLYNGDDVTTLVNGWVNSPGHYKNLMGNYSTSGVGVFTTPDGAVYATQIFARK